MTRASRLQSESEIRLEERREDIRDRRWARRRQQMVFVLLCAVVSLNPRASSVGKELISALFT
jgi:hypothetical protein